MRIESTYVPNGRGLCAVCGRDPGRHVNGDPDDPGRVLVCPKAE